VGALVLWQKADLNRVKLVVAVEKNLRFFEIRLAPVSASRIFTFTFFTSESGSGGKFGKRPLPIR
jgi:hypothetical protein